MIKLENTIGVVLAGGLSRRMDKREKSLINLGNKTLIEKVVLNLSGQVGSVLINANGDPERFSFLDCPVQADTIEGFAGPLAGILAAMEWAAKNAPNKTHILSAAADTPFFPKDYAEQMITQANGINAEIALAASNERHHPVFGLWPLALKDALFSFLENPDNRKVMLFVQQYENIRVDFSFTDLDPFFNVNTQEDLEKAERILELQEC